MTTPTVNIVQSKISTQERFFQLYRKMYPLFLAGDFIHKKDYERELSQLNNRISDLQNKVNQLMQSMAAYTTQMATHIHPHSQGATGAPIPLARFTPTAIVTALVPHSDAELMKRATELVSSPQAIAPLAEGTSTEARVTEAQQTTTQGF